MKKMLLIAAAAGFALFTVAHAQERAVAVPAPKVDQYPENGKQVAVLAGGCFWGVGGVFEHVKGVSDVTAGYAGGAANTATYEQVGGEGTGHAEAVRIVYNPAQISYGKLLQIYFSVAHNPTELNRQGPDSGTSYRSAIFVQNATQKDIATKYIAQLQAAHAFPKPIVTKLERSAFYPAEAYHQHFLARNPTHPYIVINDAPKVAALKVMYPGLYHQ